MDVYEAIEALLEEHGPGIGIPKVAWFCTELTAYTLDLLSGGFIPHGGTRWQQLNIWDATRPWTPVGAGLWIAGELSPSPSRAFGPMIPSQLPSTLPPGLYLAQGWVELPDPPQEPGDGHAFFIEVYPPEPGEVQLCRVIESSKVNGLRVSGRLWAGGALPEPHELAPRLRRFRAGVGLVLLMPSPATETQDLGGVPPEPEQSEPEGVDMAEKVDITEQERDEILTRATSEWTELLDGIREGTVTPGDFVEAGFDIVIKVATALIPGTLDDMAVGFFQGQLDTLKEAAGSAADRFFGIRGDVTKLTERAAQRRAYAAEHIEKAEAKEAAGKSGGLFSKSPEAHRARAAALLELAAEDEARASSLGA